MDPQQCNQFPYRKTVIQHSAFMKDHQWKFRVKCRLAGGTASKWRDLQEVFPGATFQVNKTSVAIETQRCSIINPMLFCLVGTCDSGDCKRMQVAVFGGRLVFGKSWIINACLIDDDRNALKVSNYEGVNVLPHVGEDQHIPSNNIPDTFVSIITSLESYCIPPCQICLNATQVCF